MSKNIVLCSDGTGNSGSKAQGTNVYRIFKAVDRTCVPQQVAFYDDGVGTESLKLLKIMGGAFGFGLSRNLRQLYRFLVEQYDDGDQIYLFGFSRGAHTVAVLAHMIVHCGVIDKTGMSSDQIDAAVHAVLDGYKDMHTRVKLRWHYRSWLPSFSGRTSINVLTERREELGIRFHGKAARSDSEAVRAPLDESTSEPQVPIKFIGVWDTVDAVGLPIDELTDAFAWFFPLRFPDDRIKLHPGIKAVYHALAIDDERHTFNPVLWVENGETQGQTVEQVWFAGMHSNVGGGYRRDQMAHVSLNWMMHAAMKHNLYFEPSYWAEFAREIDPLGKMYDSRSGLGVLYRYRPRSISRLCELHGVRPKFHESAWQRIKEAAGAYAPSVIPDEFDIVADPLLATSHPVRLKPETQARLDCSRNWIWPGRCLYFLAMVLLLWVVLFCISSAAVPPPVDELPIIAWIFDPLLWLVPRFLDDWVNALRYQPRWAMLFAATFGIMVWLGSRTRRRIRHHATLAWKGEHGQLPPSSSAFQQSWWQQAWTKLRESKKLMSFAEYFRRIVVPGLTSFVLACLVGVLIFRTWWASREWKSQPLQTPTENALLHPPTQVTFDTVYPNFATGIWLKQGECYEIQVEVGEEWIDKSFPASPNGLSNPSDSRRLAICIPLRRVIGEPWYKLIGAIGPEFRDLYSVGSQIRFRARTSGELYLFVNDAVYENNKGTATIKVNRIRP